MGMLQVKQHHDEGLMRLCRATERWTARSGKTDLLHPNPLLSWTGSASPLLRQVQDGNQAFLISGLPKSWFSEICSTFDMTSRREKQKDQKRAQRGQVPEGYVLIPERQGFGGVSLGLALWSYSSRAHAEGVVRQHSVLRRVWEGFGKGSGEGFSHGFWEVVLLWVLQ